MKALLGKKLGMTQIFDENGNAQPATLLQAGPCTVTQVLSKDTVGYSAVQLGFGSKKLNKPRFGHVREFTGEKNKGFAFLREFTMGEESALKRGDVLDVSQFETGDIVSVSGITKGKGFQGVVRRWGFAGGPKSHGQKHSLRAPGSIGSAYPQHVMKGKKMGGHMGSERKSIKNLRVVYVDPQQNILALRGAVPGTVGNYVEIIQR